MILKKDFALRKVADTWIVLPLAEETVDFNGMLVLNDSGVLIWNALKENCNMDTVVEVLMNEYDVTYDQAMTDATEFVNKLIDAGCIEE